MIGPRLVGGALVVIATLSLLGCTATSPPPASAGTALCATTVAHMTPPAEAVDFYANGSSTPDKAKVREELKNEMWLGNDAMWIILPPNGEIVGRLDDKITPHRTRRGHVQYEARQLDGPGSVTTRPIGPDAYGDIGFQAGGPAFPTVGCWEVTYTLDGNEPLRFVVRVR
ncbi:MAG: hypothetical protein ABJA81_13230 [Nocardioidaceae bacterium]